MKLQLGVVRSALLAWSLTCLTIPAGAQEPPPPPPVTPAAPPAGAPPATSPETPAPAAPDAAAPPTPAPNGEPTPPAATPEPGADLPLEPGQPLPPVPTTPDPAVEMHELDARVAALDAYLKDQQPRSRAYFGAWISLLGALTIGQALQATFTEDDPGARASYIAGSSFSAVSLGLVLIIPTPGRNAYRKYSAMPEGTLDEKRAKAIQGEEWLRGEASAVRRTKGWFVHTLGALFGVGGFLGLYLGYDDNLDNALRTGIGTFLIAELRIWTRPYRAIRYLDAYRKSPTTTPDASMFALVPMLVPRGQGLMLAGRF